jgi:hypothetical protein
LGCGSLIRSNQLDLVNQHLNLAPGLVSAFRSTFQIVLHHQCRGVARPRVRTHTTVVDCRGAGGSLLAPARDGAAEFAALQQQLAQQHASATSRTPNHPHAARTTGAAADRSGSIPRARRACYVLEQKRGHERDEVPPPASHAPHTHTAHDLSRLSSFLCLFFHVFCLAAHATHTCMHVAPTHTHRHPHTHIMEGRRANDKGQAPAQTAAQGWLRGPTVKRARARGRRQQDGREVREAHPWTRKITPLWSRGPRTPSRARPWPAL